MFLKLRVCFLSSWEERYTHLCLMKLTTRHRHSIWLSPCLSSIKHSISRKWQNLHESQRSRASRQRWWWMPEHQRPIDSEAKKLFGKDSLWRTQSSHSRQNFRFLWGFFRMLIMTNDRHLWNITAPSFLRHQWEIKCPIQLIMSHLPCNKNDYFATCYTWQTS